MPERGICPGNRICTDCDTGRAEEIAAGEPIVTNENDGLRFPKDVFYVHERCYPKVLAKRPDLKPLPEQA
jgi:hypothetical protein